MKKPVFNISTVDSIIEKTLANDPNKELDYRFMLLRDPEDKFRQIRNFVLRSNTIAYEKDKEVVFDSIPEELLNKYVWRVEFNSGIGNNCKARVGAKIYLVDDAGIMPALKDLPKEFLDLKYLITNKPNLEKFQYVFKDGCFNYKTYIDGRDLHKNEHANDDIVSLASSWSINFSEPDIPVYRLDRYIMKPLDINEKGRYGK